MIASTQTIWPDPAGKLRGVSPDRLDAVTATFTVADWARMEDEHLDVIGLRLLEELKYLGIDMDDDPIAVFCRLYLDARSVRLSNEALNKRLLTCTSEV